MSASESRLSRTEPRRVFFIEHATGIFDWRAYAEKPELRNECARYCRVVEFRRVPKRKVKVKRGE